MGYEIHFKPSAEKMETYKPWGYDKPNYESEEKRVESTRLELLSYCLKDHKESGTYQIQKQIEFYLKLLSGQIEANEKEFAYKRWLEDDEHELWYCGWEFSHEEGHDIDIITQETLEHLVLLSYVVETPNFFSDRENFWEKYRVIRDYLEDYISAVETHYIHQIINDLDEFKVGDDYAEDIRNQIEEGKEEIEGEEKFDKKFKVKDGVYDFTSDNDEEALAAFKKLSEDDTVVISKPEENNENEYGLMDGGENID